MLSQFLGTFKETMFSSDDRAARVIIRRRQADLRTKAHRTILIDRAGSPRDALARSNPGIQSASTRRTSRTWRCCSRSQRCTARTPTLQLRAGTRRMLCSLWPIAPDRLRPGTHGPSIPDPRQSPQYLIHRPFRAPAMARALRARARTSRGTSRARPGRSRSAPWSAGDGG